MLIKRTMKRTLILTIFLLFLSSQARATTYYVRDDGSDSDTGLSDAQAWLTISKVNNKSDWVAGDDVYFKCNDTWTNETLTVDWNGVDADNYAVIGAYEGNGDTTLEGDETKPIIQGTYIGTLDDPNGFPTSRYDQLIGVPTGQSYVEILNINLKNSNAQTCEAHQSTYIKFTNLDTSHCLQNGLNFNDVDYGEISGCTVTDTCRVQTDDPDNNWPAAIGLSPLNRWCTVKNNKVHENYGEGIGIYKQSNQNTIEYNTVYDNLKGNIYIDGGWGNTVRYNLVYHTANTTFHRDTGDGWGSQGIWIAREDGTQRVDPSLNVIYGNLVASCYWGINIGNIYGGGTATGVKIYNNTVVDCDVNIRVGDADYDAEIKNNISYCITSAGYRCDQVSGSPDSSLDFDYNLWSSAHGGDSDFTGANDPTPAVPDISKTSGWRALVAGAVDGTEFALTSTSDAIDVGASLNSAYIQNLNVDNSDFTAFTFELLCQGDYGSGWDIGADVYQAGGEDPPVSGNNDFSTDDDCYLVANFESGALTTDSKGGNTLVAGDPPAEDTTNYKQGSCSADFINANTDFYLVTDGNLDTNFPLKTGDTQKIISTAKWICPDSSGVFDVIASKWVGSTNKRSVYIALNTSDQLELGLGFNSGASSETHAHGSTLTRNQTTWYHVSVSYDDSDKSYALRVRDASFAVLGTDVTGTATLDANKLSVTDANLSIACFNSEGTPANYLDSNLDELVFFDKFLTAQNETDIASGLYSIAISVQSATATAGTVTDTGDHSITLIWDREPYITVGVNGPPYVWANVYDGTNYAKYEYVEKSGVNATYTASLTEIMRSTASGAQTQLDFKAGETSIICPDGTTITDLQGRAAVLTGLDALDIDNETYISIPGIITIGTSGLFPLWSNGSTGFHDVLHDEDNDKFNVLDPITDDFAISADNVRIRGTGGNVAITGGIELLGTCTGTIIKCLTFSGGITDNGNDYVYQENCRGGVLD